MSKMSTDLQAPQRSVHLIGGKTMGTHYSARFVADQVDQASVGAALFAAVDAVDRQMSTWKPDSDLTRLNAAPVGQWVKVPPEMALVLSEALRIGRASGGAFDIAVGDAVNAWGFGSAGAREGRQPSVAPASVRPAATDSLEFDGAREYVRTLAPVSLDLCGIAKGFGVDELARCLERFGITSYLVGIDGELRARGRKPNGTLWTVAIERPDYELRDVMGVLELSDTAIATSGDYRHWVEMNGAKLSHTMDPRTGEPLRNGIASVTILASNCMEADAWATALMVMGEDAGLEFARARGLDAIFVIREGSHLVERGVGRFAFETKC
ncbi:FAD:protein FMN transferase [Dongia sp.]|uniref:FAD:protein FMN transferase n=1 Tax=Dongia sp. TaxID=1977262 RepID=UPI0035AF72E4